MFRTIHLYDGNASHTPGIYLQKYYTKNTKLSFPQIPIFALVTQNVILLNEIIERKADLLESSLSVENGDETAKLIGALQQERSAALMGLFLREGFDSITDKIDYNIDTLRIATDVKLDRFSAKHSICFLGFPGKYHFMESLQRRGLVQI